jgi:hypothetical protein
MPARANNNNSMLCLIHHEFFILIQHPPSPLLKIASSQKPGESQKVKAKKYFFLRFTHYSLITT